MTLDENDLPDEETWTTADEAVTADEQRRGRTLDERLEEETREDDAAPERAVGELVEEDRPDTEGELVSAITPDSDREDDSGEVTDESVEDAGWDQGVEDAPSAEELAVTVRDEAPGGTDDESDDYVAGDQGAA